MANHLVKSRKIGGKRKQNKCTKSKQQNKKTYRICVKNNRRKSRKSKRSRKSRRKRGGSDTEDTCSWDRVKQMISPSANDAEKKFGTAYEICKQSNGWWRSQQNKFDF